MTFILISLYVLLLGAVVYKTRDSQQTTSQYLVAKKSLGVLSVAASATAGVLDVTSIFVLFGSLLLFGPAGIGLWIAYIGATVLMAILTPYFYRTVQQENILTLSDFFKERFGSYTEKMFGVVSSLFVLGIVVGLYSINLVLFERFFDIGPALATALSFLITVLYVVLGGFKMLVRTDVLQYVVMAAFLQLAVLFFPGGEIVERSVDLTSWFGPVFWMFAPVIFVQNMLKPAAWQPVIGAKNAKTAQAGMWLAVLFNVLIVAPIVWVSLGYAQLLSDSAPTDVLLDALGLVLPSFVTPFVFIGLLAALMSSLDSALFYIGSNITRNLLPKRLTLRYGEKRLVQYMVVGVSLASVLLAIYVPNFITFVLNMMPLIGLIALPFFVALFRSCRSVDRGTLVAYVLGVVAFGYLFLNPPEAYIWNIVPIVTTGVVFLAALVFAKFQPKEVFVLK